MKIIKLGRLLPG